MQNLKFFFFFLFSVLFYGTPFSQGLSSSCSHALKSAFTYKTYEGAQQSLGKKRCPLERQLITWHFMKEGAHDGDFKAYKTFVERHKGWPWIFKIRREAEKRLNDKELKAAQKWFQDSSPKTLEGSTALIRSYIQSGNKAKARRTAKDLWVHNDYSKQEAQTYLDRFGSILTEEDHFKRGRHWLSKGKADPALQTVTKVTKASRRLVLEAQIALLQNTQKARRLYNKAKVHRAKDYELQLSYLQWLRRTHNDYAAKYVLRHPNMVRFAPERTWKEIHILLRRALEKGNRRQAAHLSKAHALTSGTNFAEAEWLKGWLTLKQDKNPHQAQQIFEAGYGKVTTPISRSRFAFWAGLATDAANKEGPLRETSPQDWYTRAAQHPGTFYGQQALQKLGIQEVPSVPPLTAQKKLVARVKKSVLFKAARTLLKAEQPNQAQSFLHMLIKSAATIAEEDAILKAVLDLSPQHLVGIAKEASPTRNLYFKELYPLLSKRHHKAYKAMDPTLFHAVIRKESMFDSQLVSWAGAMGLTQLLPATAKETAKSIGLKFNKKKLLSDSPYNSQIGAAYLASRLKKFDDNVPLSLVAYNAGIKYAYEWQTLFGDPRTPGIDLLDWIESLPFGETRNYLQRVLENQKVYRCVLHKKCAHPSVLKSP